MSVRHLASLLTILSIASVSIGAAPAARAQEVVDGYHPRAWTGRDGVTMPYRLFLPDAEARKRPLPLIIYLHGSGGAGTDNLKQLASGNTSGTHLWTQPDLQRRHPAYVLAPQADTDAQWSAPDDEALAPYAARVVQLVESLIAELGVDRDRIYLIGQSRGGRGTWDLVSKRPDLFAAAVPVCGDGNTTRVRAARAVPIWAFHGVDDEVIPVAGSRDLVAALRAVGSAVRYSEYPGVGHNVWLKAFAEPELPEWLFAQRREGGRR